MDSLYDHAEALAISLLESAPAMMHNIFWLQGLFCLLLGAVACQLWHAAHWKAPPLRADRRDWLTCVAMKSLPACAALSLALLLCGLLWAMWLFVEYVSWMSPEAEAAAREAAARGEAFSDVSPHNDVSGRIVSFPASLFGIGCVAWALVWLWRARAHVKGLCSERATP